MSIFANLRHRFTWLASWAAYRLALTLPLFSRAWWLVLPFAGAYSQFASIADWREALKTQKAPPPAKATGLRE